MVTPGSCPPECESFNELKRECTRDEQVDLDLLTLRVLKDLILFLTKKPSLPLTSEEKKLQYRFKPTWGSFQRKRSKLGSSKPHTHYQLPNLNVKRKRFSQPTTKEDQIEEKPPKKPKLNPTLPLSNLSPKLPQNFQNIIDTMGGTQLVLVIQKPLTKTDLNRHNARLSMPLSQINGSFLREAEREYLDQQQAMEVLFMEPSGKGRTMKEQVAAGKEEEIWIDTNFGLLQFTNFLHEAGHAAFEDAQKQVDVILGKLKTKTASIADIQTDIDKKKLEVLRARKVEQECIKEQDALISIEQAARQKVVGLKSILDTEKSQGSVLKANLQAKESN
ncbi:hypothetical protein SO802_029337 [Lithocarpus litseifolius]|uniref:Uncharacterized protein n=1 Tax=Lithocarpus litseifolius TaxID=425828 RepID=A0AAW2BUI5_9ROSI